MNPTDYVQTRCQKCGAAAWGHNTMTVTCGTCGQPIAPLASSAWNPPSPYGMAQPPGAQSFQTPSPAVSAQGTQPGVPNTQAGPSVNVGIGGFKLPVKIPVGGSKVKTGAAVVGVAALAVGGAVLKSKMSSTKSKPGMLSYASLKMDVKHIDADAMIPAVTSTALNWRKDAVFLSINLQAVHADGTVDASGGGAQVEFMSISRVNGASKKLREDAFKKFSFGPSGVDYGDQWDALEKMDVDAGPPVPHCGIKNVVKQVKGLTGDKTVRVTYDPSFDIAWHVIGEDPKVDLMFSIEDCSPIQK
jgi:ribosomal protein L37E